MNIEGKQKFLQGSKKKMQESKKIFEGKQKFLKGSKRKCRKTKKYLSESKNI